MPKEDSTGVQIAELAAQQWITALNVNIQVKQVTFQEEVGNLISLRKLQPESHGDLADWLDR